MSALIVFSTCPVEHASAIATTLVEEKLAACVNLLPGVQSVYRWEGRVESALETLLVIKVATENYAHLEQKLRTLHPYTLPEIIASPITMGFAPYLHWLLDPDHR